MSAEAGGGAAPPPGERRLVRFVCLTAALIPLNSTMIAVALPDVGDDLGAGVRSTAWLVSGYLIAMAALQPLGGKLGDRLGRRPVIVGGLLAFGGASLAAGAVSSIGWLIALRVAQATAGALMFPSAMALLREHLPASRRGRGLGMLSAAIGLAAAAGLPLGGALVSLGGWRLIFLVNAPLALLAVAMALSLVPARERSPDARFDVAGAALLCVLLIGAAALVGSVREIAAPAAVVCAVAIALLAWALVRLERRHPDPVLQPRLFGNRAFAGATAAVALSNLAMYGVLLAVPVHFTSQADWSSLKVGGVLAAFSVALVLGSPPGGRLADRLGARTVAAGGLLVFALGLIPLTVAGDEIAVWLMVLTLLVSGAGLGLANPAVQAAALNALTARDAGAGSGVFSTARYLGSIVAASLLGLLLGSSGGGDFGALLAICAGVAGLSAVVALALPGAPARVSPAVAVEAAPATPPSAVR
jgi:EmrB/QacA subfamily drug resistance transporter